jgi:alpha-ketoglutarate-dependent 2,4-dichlorophenoxyacetate dioxygenase
MKLDYRLLYPTFFAEISGVELKKDRGPDVAAAIEAVLDQHAVVVLRSQHLDDDEQIEFSLQLGQLSYAMNHGRAKSQNARLRPELYDISNLDEGNEVLDTEDRRRAWRTGDRLWHTDRSFIAADTTYSLLTGRVVPPGQGDTQFADMRAVYDDLDEETKALIADKHCEHSVWFSRALAGGTNFREDEVKSMPPVSQPMVRVHPKTGRKSLFIASHASHILEMPRASGRILLDRLMVFATQPKYVATLRWNEGDLVIWDNRITMHRGTDFDDVKYKRDMRRTTVQGAPMRLQGAA